MFSIAEKLQCGTVDELAEKMSVSEQREWQEYFKIKDKEFQKSQKKQSAKTPNKRRPIKPTRRR